MQRRLSISILNTESRSTGIFSRSFTVITTKVYNIKVTLDFTEHFQSQKRFSELFEFSQYLKPYLIKYDFPTPEFPSKQLSHNKQTIQTRKEKIQDWLKKVSYCPKFTKKLCRFFMISEEKLINNAKELDQDDFYVREFVEMLENEKNQKLNILKIFTKKFLARRRKVTPSTVKILLRSLVALCGKSLLSGLSLDLLNKLMTREYFSEYLLVVEEFCKLDSEFLAQMHLEEILIKGKCGELQAFELLNILKPSQHKENIFEIVRFIQLNRNPVAFEVYINWEKSAVKPLQKFSCSQDINLVVLYSSDKCRISYLNSPYQLDVHVSLTLNASKDKLIELVTNPTERAKWDLKMKMQKTDQNLCVFEFLHKKERFLAESQVSFDSSENFCKINFSDSGESGFASQVCIETELEGKNEESLIGSENITCATYGSCREFEEDCGRLKVSMKFSCKGKWVKAFSDDVVHESTVLIKSIKRLISMCENLGLEEDSGQVCMLDFACTRKYLNKSVLF